jgi:ABC-2 type transport system ATP-binding protein
VQKFVEELRDEHAATIVLTTHDLDEAERLCARIGLLNDGRLVAEGTSSELRERAGLESGQPATLHDVFMRYTGRSLDDDVEDDDNDE